MNINAEELIFDEYCDLKENFKWKKLYLRLGEKDKYNHYYLNENNEVQLVNISKTRFELDKKVIKKIEEVVCICEDKNRLLKKFETYGVYDIYIDNNSYFSKGYKVLRQDNTFSYMYDLYFVSKEQYNELVENNSLSEFIANREEEISKNIKLEETLKEEKNKNKKIKEEKEKAINLFKNFTQYSNETVMFKAYINECTFYIIYAIIAVICIFILSLFESFLDKTVILESLILGFGAYGLTKLISSIININKIRKDLLKVNKINDTYNYKEANKLSYETLGKIKYIENIAKDLEKENFNKEVISLLNKTVDLTMKLSISIEDNSILKLETELNDYLDKCIEYIEILYSSQEFENKYIAGKMIEETQDLIVENKQLLKSMLKDYDLIYSNFYENHSSYL